MSGFTKKQEETLRKCADFGGEANDCAAIARDVDSDLSDAEERIESLQDKIEAAKTALETISDDVRKWRWGWDGDCGVENHINQVVNDAVEEIGE